MRVAHYCRHALVGQTGVANSARGWAEAIAAAGHDVALVIDAGQRNLDDVPGVETRALEHRRLGPVTLPTGLAAAVAGADVAVLHGAWDPTTTFAASRCRAAGVPYIVLPHGAYHRRALLRGGARKRVYAALAERRMLRRALAVHLLFDDEAAWLEASGIRTPRVVAPNGTEPRDGRWDGGSGGYLLFLGRYDPEHKGLDLLLEGLSLVAPERRPQLRLHGPDWHGGRAQVGDLVERLGLADDVVVGDPIYGQAKWDLLQAARAFVLPSRWEASPMSLAEAAALGVPALVGDYAMGRLFVARDAAVPAGDTPASIARAIEAVVAPEAADLGPRARQLVSDELTWERVARSWVSQVAPMLEG